MEGAWTDVKQDLALGLLLHHHRQAAVHLAARSRQHALGELLLHHEDGSANHLATCRSVGDGKKQRRRDLVGQIPHHHERTARRARRRGEIKVQRIGALDPQARTGSQLLLEQRGQLRIMLDGDDLAGLPDQSVW